MNQLRNTKGIVAVLLLLFFGCVLPLVLLFLMMGDSNNSETTKEGVVTSITKVAGKSYEEKRWDSVSYDGKTSLQVEKIIQGTENDHWNITIKLNSGQTISRRMWNENSVEKIQVGSRVKVVEQK